MLHSHLTTLNAVSQVLGTCLPRTMPALRRDIGLKPCSRILVSAYNMLGYHRLCSATSSDALQLALPYPAPLGTLSDQHLDGWINLYRWPTP